MNLFNSSNSWLSDLATDEAFVAALHREQQEVIDNPQGLIPTDPNNILSLKMRFSDMVR